MATSSAASDAGTDGSFVQIRSDVSEAGTDGSFVKLDKEAEQQPPPAEDKDDGTESFASLPDFNEAEADFTADDDAASVADTAKNFEVIQSSSAAASPEQAAPTDSEVRSTLEQAAAAPEQPEEQPTKAEPATESDAAKVEVPQPEVIHCTFCNILVRGGSQWSDHIKCNLHLNKVRLATKRTKKEQHAEPTARTRSRSRARSSAPAPEEVRQEEPKEPRHTEKELDEYQFRYVPDDVSWKPRAPLDPNFRIRGNPPNVKDNRERRRLRGMVDEGLLPPFIPGYVPNRDFFRYYEPGVTDRYDLLWTDEYDRRKEEDQRKARGETGRIINSRSASSASSTSAKAKARAPSRRSPSRRSPSRRSPSRHRAGHSPQRSSSARRLPGDYVADDTRITFTGTASSKVTLLSAPDRDPPSAEGTANRRWSRSSSRGASGGSKAVPASSVLALAAQARALTSQEVKKGFVIPWASTPASGSSGSSSQPPVQQPPRPESAQGKRSRQSSKSAQGSQADKTKLEREASPRAAEASKKLQATLRHTQCLDLAENLDARLQAVVSQQGEGAAFTTSVRAFQQLLRAILSSRELDATYLSDDESAGLLDELRRLDEEFPTPSGSAAGPSDRKGYKAAVQHTPPSPPTPEPGSIYFLGPGNRKIFQTQVVVILDFADSLADRWGGIPRSHTDAVRSCMRHNIVFDIVSYIGVKDLYAYTSDRFPEGTKTDGFYRTIESRIRSNNLPRAPAPGVGYIRNIRVVNDRCGHPHNSKALEAKYGIHRHQTTGGKDWYAYHNGAAAIVDDHAGANLGYIEIGMISFLLEVGHNADHIRPQRDTRVYRTFVDALVDLETLVQDPATRLDLEIRQKNILRPSTDIHHRTDCANAADPYYARLSFRVWRASDLVAWKAKGGHGKRCSISPTRE